ncbi:MFS transporter [Cumulibacter soli]|uniref:MFS transporter n=1 Tax=Cumulibacter soli TaxID=2546344 RepID=UPI001068AAB8|nr:MFS transporter [Cumulibacter soli]
MNSTNEQEPAANPSLAIAILAFTGMTVSIMQTIVVPLLPHLPGILSASRESATWVLTVTLMVGAVFTPIAGRLGDMIGKRRMLMITTAMMVIGSLVCVLSSSLAPMLVGRALQGMSLGSISLGISLMRDIMPKERLGSAVALMSATLGIGGAIGLPISAIVAQHLSWHVLFAGSAAFGAIACLAVVLFIPESAVRSGGSFDILGAITFSGMLISLLFGLTKTADWGWGNWRVYACFVVAMLFGLMFSKVERRAPHPMVDIPVTLQPTVRYTNLASILVGFAMYTCNMAVTELLQAPKDTGYGFGTSMVVAGLCAAPMGFLMMVLSPAGAKLIKVRGARFAFRSGIAVIGVGFAIGVFMVNAAWELIIVAMFVGAGVALSYAAAPTLIMSAVPQTQTAAANSVNTLARSMGTSLAAAIHGSILASAFVVGGTSYGPLNPFQLCFLLAVIACAVAYTLGAFIPKEPREIVTTPVAEAVTN